MSNVKPIPQSEASKKQQVMEMFDSISPRYDLLNRLLSFGIDVGWRKKAIKELQPIQPKRIIDLACGTGDLSVAAMKLNPIEVVGVDISEGMLEVGREKMKRLKLDENIHLEKGDSENLHFSDNSFDAATVGFGVRNFENLLLGLKETFRVLKPGGKLVVLEFSKPTSFPFKQIYHFYFHTILPFWGRYISKNDKAYKYLPESVKNFPDGDRFLEVMKEAGFHDLTNKSLTQGVCSIYTGIK